ncbi:hypothetical protein Tco_0968824 [Tanacetum coccineum]
MVNGLERQTSDEKLVLLDDDGKSLKKVNYLVNADSDSDAEEDDFDDCGLADEQMRGSITHIDMSWLPGLRRNIQEYPGLARFSQVLAEYPGKDADHCSKNVKRKSSLEPTTTVLLAKNTRYY